MEPLTDKKVKKIVVLIVRLRSKNHCSHYLNCLLFPQGCNHSIRYRRWLDYLLQSVKNLDNSGARYLILNP